MHFESRSLHAPSDLSVEKRKKKSTAQLAVAHALWSTEELLDLESKCMDTFLQNVLYPRYFGWGKF